MATGSEALLCLIQGPAELLPVSSSGHVEAARLLWGLEGDEVALHAGVLVGAWTVTCFFACLLLAGQSQLIVGTVITLSSLAILVIILCRFILPERLGAWLQVGTVTLIDVLIPAATLWMFAIARRRAMITTATTIAGLAVWGLLAAIAWVFPPLPGVVSDVRVMAFLTAALSLTVAPLAAGPLALSWNRHR